MDPLRISKGSSGTSKQTPPGDANTTGGSTSIPLAIRFNAGEESVEEILPPTTANADSVSPSMSSIADPGQSSLSSSPQLNSDDFSWRKDFLQSSFFHRKRSGSVEGTGGGVSPGSCLISNLSSSSGDPNTVGTWKLIKGRVSQAMEDIKSKNIPASAATISIVSTQKATADTNGGADSDPETATSDDISLDLSTGAIAPQQSSIQKQKALPVTSQVQNSANDSDFDADAEILDIDTIQAPVVPSTIKRPFASLRTKTLSGSSVKTTPIKKLTNTTSTVPVNGKEDNKLFRRRKRDKSNDYSTSVIRGMKPKKDVEIESGVEMLEDMILPQSTSGSNQPNESQTDKYTTTKFADDKSDRNSPLPEYYDALPSLSSRNTPQDSVVPKHLGETTQGTKQQSQSENECRTMGQLLMQCLLTAYKSRSIIVTLALLAIFLALPLGDFFCGVVACLLTISLVTSITEAFSLLIERSDLLLKLIGMQGNGPEKIPFQIPDYNKLPICEIPAAEEHKPLKSYAGWMTEINNYDPANFHISMTRPIYARLDGSILRISNTNARIPKRSMWNEQPIHRKNVTFTRHRCFNLLGCRVEMCPRGLARKRYFNRKYPIQLIINTTETVRFDGGRIVGMGTALQTDTDISITQEACSISHQNSNESNEDHSDRQTNDFDFGTAVLHSNLQKLHDNQQQRETTKETTVPCGDETRLLLFARCDREKEDWYRRFLAASVGKINEQELQNPDIVMMSEDEITAAIRAVPSTMSTSPDQREELALPTATAEGGSDETAKRNSKTGLMVEDDNLPFEGLIIAPNAARNAYDYIRFMSLYQKACRKSATKMPVIKSPEQLKQQNRRQKKQDELWKGIDQTLFLGPSSSVVWANVLIGRVLYSCLNDQMLLEKIQEFLQKKLSAIKLPSFMEDVVIAQTYLGDTAPLIHRVSQPILDERGVWIDADITYEGLMHMTITTKLNLLRLKRQQQQSHQQQTSHEAGNICGSASNESYNGVSGENILQSESSNGASAMAAGGDGSSSIAITPTGSTKAANFTTSSAIYDSDAESTGASSSDSEAPALGAVDPTVDSPIQSGATPTGSSQTFGPGNSRRLLRIVDRITASNLFQSATEISYIQRAMENMSTKITLRVELKGLVARIAINLPPPPSDRIWIGFRGPPRLWISAKPAVGDHTFDWSIVTNVIESKLCDEVYKYLVYPNMVDIIAPFLGQSTYKE